MLARLGERLPAVLIDTVREQWDMLAKIDLVLLDLRRVIPDSFAQIVEQFEEGECLFGAKVGSDQQWAAFGRA